VNKLVMCYHNDSILLSGKPNMPNLLIRHVPAKTLSALKARAKKNKRSLQAELSEILEKEAKKQAEEQFWIWAEQMRKKIGKQQTDSTILIREDRDR